MVNANVKLEDYNTKQGVYMIKNLTNNKCYIGSTVMTFSKRCEHHIWNLNKNSHKNSHLQNSWNKYGSENFEITILEICDKNLCLEREQYYLDTILFAQEFINEKNTLFQELGYNINPLATGTPNLSKETIEKRTKTFKKIVSKASEYYNQYKNGEIDLDDIPDEQINLVKGWLNTKIWNKGKTYDSTDHLKVSKTITKELLQAHKNTSERSRNKSPIIAVFDINYKFIGIWKSSKDLEEFSENSDFKFPLILKGRSKGKFLNSGNIMKQLKNNKPYKGLYFSIVPEESVKGSLKWGKYGELCDGNTVLTYSPYKAK